MVSMAEACAECTQNCLLMHKKDKNPSSVATTFFKVMFGDDYSKVMYLPPRFGHTVRNMVGKETQLEDSSGEKWTVKFTKVDGLLAFEEGWNKFSLDHGIKMGDFLVFHYIMGSHFVVLMYGPSGCPEIRHYGFTRHQKKKNRKKGKFIADDHRPSNVNTNGHHRLHESSSQSERSVYGVNEQPEIRHSGVPLHKKKRVGTDTTMPPDVNTTNAHHHSFASSSQPGLSVSDKEMSQRSEPLVTNTCPDNMVSETPKTVEPFCLVDRDTGNVEDESRRSCLHDLSIFEIHQGESDGGRKNEVPARVSGDETQNNESGKLLETRFKESVEKPKETAVMLTEATYDNSIKRRLRSARPPTKKTEKAEKELVGTSDKDDMVKEFRVTRANMAKKESVWASDTDTSGSRLHNVSDISASPGIFLKPMAKPMEVTKKELTKTHGLDGAIGTFSGCKSKDTKMGSHSSVKNENDDSLPTVKPEPVDYDEVPPSGASNTSFTAVMSSYQYLELPEWVNLQSKVILLRNGDDRWPVLCRSELGLKALTYCWEEFARANGIQPGDECEFVLESEPEGQLTCSMFRVDVTRK